MSNSLLTLQGQLPRLIPLVLKVPQRRPNDWTNWKPEDVKSSEDLPEYLMLGLLDEDTVDINVDGWFARWQGLELDTYFDVKFKRDAHRYEMKQVWCGVEGGFSFLPAQIPFQEVILQAVMSMYMKFPNGWDELAKSDLESRYQLKYMPQPTYYANMAGVPDGAFKSIVIPAAVRNLRPVKAWLESVTEEEEFSYPVSAEAKLLFQAINYVEGKAPDWTASPAALFDHSLRETGLVPHGFPVRESDKDSTAWTLRRDVYVLHIFVPFAGLNDLLEKLTTKTGPIQDVGEDSLPIEISPVVLPAGFEFQSKKISYWNSDGSIRSTLVFKREDGTDMVDSVEEISTAWNESGSRLRQAEETSGKVIEAIDSVMRRTLGKRERD